MKNTKKVLKSKSKLGPVKVTTGTIEDFFARTKNIMRSFDKNEAIENRSATLTFEDPLDMLHFLSAAKIKLISVIRKHPDSVTNIAKLVKRTRNAVYRDVQQMERFGLVKTYEEINPGHGRHKVVKLTATTLKLEAFV